MFSIMLAVAYPHLQPPLSLLPQQLLRLLLLAALFLERLLCLLLCGDGFLQLQLYTLRLVHCVRLLLTHCSPMLFVNLCELFFEVSHLAIAVSACVDSGQQSECSQSAASGQPVSSQCTW